MLYASYDVHILVISRSISVMQDFSAVSDHYKIQQIIYLHYVRGRRPSYRPAGFTLSQQSINTEVTKQQWCMLRIHSPFWPFIHARKNKQTNTKYFMHSLPNQKIFLTIKQDKNEAFRIISSIIFIKGGSQPVASLGLTFYQSMI